jgi:membrane dipeptidase
MNTRRAFLAQSSLLALAIGARAAWAAESAASGVTPALLKRAKALLEKAPLIDTHNDLPSMLLEEGVAGDLTKYDLNLRQPKLCADIPALREGGVGAQYWSIFVEAETMKTHVSLHEAMREFDVALRMIAQYPDFEQARTADDIERIHKAGKIACLMGVEGGHMIESSPAVLRVFHALGARYMTLTHWDNLEWADSATDRPEHFGLTDLGRRLVLEMNRLGMFADLSHVSADTMRAALKVTRAPVIFSHSNAYALNPHPRNVPDDVLKGVAANGGVVHVNFIRAFVARKGNEWVQQEENVTRELQLKLGDDAAVKKAIAEWDKANLLKVSIADAADHIDHIRQVAGIDHIGIGADYYDVKVESMVDGLGDVTRYPYLFAELLKRGYTDEDVLKIAGRNHLRALRQMEKVSADLRRTEVPLVTEGSRPAWN